MKKFKFLSLVMVAGAAALLTACTSESENGPSNNISYESIKAAEQVPVTFGTYMGEQAITRSGASGTISPIVTPSTTANAVLANKGGFGVFAYYTNAPYNSSTKPDFMYDQAVTSTDAGANWLYSPIKYWPNDFANGAVDNQTTTAAQGTKTSYLSFFAYAPYVATTSAPNGYVGDTSYGITGFSHNDVAGDPWVSYKFDPTGKKSVDLLWGVAGSSDPSVIGGTTPQTTTAGKPLVDLVKQKTGGHVNFNFKHALARLGLTVRAANDQADAGGNALYDGSDDAKKTRIFIESVSITSDFYSTAVLNLNNGTANVPNWGTQAGSVTSLTINNTNANLNPDLDYTGTLGTYFSTRPGVITTTSTPLMVNSTDDANNPLYFMVIPKNLTTFSVNIVYHVITKDDNLDGGYSNITNNITKTIDSGLDLSAGYGKAYTLNLVLGVTSVKVTATVEDWGDQTATQVYLPINVN